MTTNNQRDSKAALVADRAVYEALISADCDLHIDIGKVRAVAHVCSTLREPHVCSPYDSAEYFEDPVRREEFLRMFRALISSFGAAADLLAAVEKSADSLSEFCCRVREVQSFEKEEVC